MAVRSWIYQGVNVGVEGAGTPGTSVAANKKLSSVMVSPSSQVDITRYRASGFKFPSVQALNREWSEARISGPVTYTEIVYFLSSLLKTVTPVGAGDDKTWTFNPASAASDPVTTYTVEYGSAVRAEKFTYGLVSALTMRFNNSAAEIDGIMLGRAMQDGITLTAAPTMLDLIPVTRPHVTLKIATTQAGLTAASPLTRGFAVEWAMTNRYAPIWALIGSVDWDAHVEIEPQLQLKLLLEANAVGMDLRTQMRSGATRFLRIEATGPEIDGGPATNSLVIDTAVKIGEPSEYRDQGGVTAIEWTLNAVHDATWNAATQVVVVNEVATL